jgi:hypothetical protein
MHILHARGGRSIDSKIQSLELSGNPEIGQIVRWARDHKDSIDRRRANAAQRLAVDYGCVALHCPIYCSSDRDFETEGLSQLKNSSGLQTIGMTTNGIVIKRHLKMLRDCGLDQLNISLDTLDTHQFQLLTRRNGLEKVLSAINGALDIGIPQVKVNVVVMNGVNDGEILKFVELTRHLPVAVRFIEYMPFGGEILY